jgi:thiosulfate/3-mercaptopyruvate sulfurtransferase
MPYVNSHALVETNWLEEHLNDTDLRLLDCRVLLLPEDAGGFRLESGRPNWEEGHIPGSGFVDFVTDLSDPHSALPLMMPPAAQFADAMTRAGVSAHTRVILYDDFYNIWAARVWWMLRTSGFDNAAVLNGGWHKWTQEGRPVSDRPVAPTRGQFVATPRPALMAGKQEVLEAIQTPSSCLLNALTAEDHAGTGGMIQYPRPGRIASSENVSFYDLVDPQTHAYLPAEQLREKFEAVGATGAQHVITYCGAGIAASSEAFVLTLLGLEDVAVYDGSLMEWAADASLPMETDTAPARRPSS